MQRRMRGAERKIHEERSAGVGLLLVANLGNRVVDEVFGQMIARAFRRIDEMIVLHEQRRPLVGLAAKKAVISLEAHAERPMIEGARRRVGGVWGEVPFAERDRVIAVLL